MRIYWGPLIAPLDSEGGKSFLVLVFRKTKLFNFRRTKKELRPRSPSVASSVLGIFLHVTELNIGA